MNLDFLKNSKFDPTEDKTKSEENKTIVKYINALYLIELLRKFNAANVTLMTAYQYGSEFLTPWRNDINLTKEFLRTNRYQLQKYNIYNACKAVQKLLGLYAETGTELYTEVPMDPNTRISILNCLDNAKNVTKFRRRMFDESQLDLKLMSSESNVRYAHSNFSDFEIADRILCALFNKYTELNRDLDLDSTKMKFGPHRKEKLDNRSYMCLRLLQDTMDIQIQDLDRGIVYNNFGAYASILSMLFRLYIPACIHPNRLERMYEKYVLRMPYADQAISYGRTFCNVAVEDVIGDKLPDLCKLKEFDTDLPTRNMSNGIDPDNLIEQYLITQYLAQYNNLW